MSSEVKCSVLNSVMRARGVSISQVAQSVGSSEGRVQDIVSGRVRPTQQEFDNLARSLDIRSEAPHDSAHTTA